MEEEAETMNVLDVELVGMVVVSIHRRSWFFSIRGKRNPTCLPFTRLQSPVQTLPLH